METMAPFPISKTKIIAPRRRSEIVTRPRLMETLYELINKKLVLISAPAGYGKTSLLIDLASQSEIPFCWLSLDVLDQEPQRFLAYFVACIANKFPTFGKEAFAMLQNISSVEKDIERLAVVLTNEIFSKIPEHFAIVLDDYHFVDPISEIQVFINRFIQLASENTHLILASRALPFLPDLHLLVARDQVGGISFEDLAFLPEEIQTFFRQNSGEKLSLEEANRLANETEGWVTSLTLTRLSRLSTRTPSGFLHTRTGAEVFEYFAREILEKQPADVHEFLLLTSVFDEVEIDLSHKVLAPLLKVHTRSWRALFKAVQTSGLFIIPLGVEGRSFRYHHLFQDFLRTELQSNTPDIVHTIMSRLAQCYAEKKEWEKAHFIYEAIEDQNALVNVIEQAGNSFIRNGRIATLGNWLDKLPPLFMQKHPTLLSLQGTVVYTQGETQLGISLLGKAETIFRKTKDIENLATTLVRRAAAYSQLGDYTLALADADEVIDLATHANKESMQDSFGVAQRVKGLVLYYLGQAGEAVPWLENALRIFSSLKESSHIPILEMELGMVHRALGNNDIALKFYNDALVAWEETGNLGWRATLLNNLGVLYHSRGDYERGFTMFERALECAQRSGYIRAQALALCSLGDLLTDIEDFDRCDEAYDQALSIATKLADRHLIFYASLAKARLARLKNDLELAHKLLLAVSISKGSLAVSSEEEALFHLESGSLLLRSGKNAESVKELTQAVSSYETSDRLLELVISRLWLACALLANGQDDDAATQLNKLFSRSKNIKEPGLLIVHVKHTHQWLEKLHQPENIAAAAEQFISKANQFDRNIPNLRRKLRRISQVISISPPHLIIQSFGPVQVLYNGEKISLSDWQTKETRDLFFFFLHSKPMTKEEIASIFWPDISPARLKMRFKTSIYRLRHAIGQETIIFQDERYRFNREIDYEYDLENFQHLLTQADKEDNLTEKAALLKKAIELGRGTYLADIEAEWADAERVQIGTLYQTTLSRLAKIYLEDGQPEKALEVCKTALDVEPLLEEAHRLSMRAYAALGDHAAVARQFRMCSDIFQEELGVKPSKETELLYKQLV